VSVLHKKNKEIDGQWLCPSPNPDPDSYRDRDWERGQGERSVFQRSKN